jgi:hypothetical protein
VLLGGFTKPGEVGEILVLYSLKSLSLALFIFAGHSFLANNLRFMVKLIVKTIIINGKVHNNKRKRFIQAIKKV